MDATNAQTISCSTEEWQQTAEEVAQWAQQLEHLAHQIQPHHSATESAEQLKIAATLAKSASETAGDKSRKLRRSAANAAEKAARLAQLVIFDLNAANQPGRRDQILAWSQAITAADKLVVLSTQTLATTKQWWEFWK